MAGAGGMHVRLGSLFVYRVGGAADTGMLGVSDGKEEQGL